MVNKKVVPLAKRIRRFIHQDINNQRRKAKVNEALAAPLKTPKPEFREFRGMLGDGSEVYLRIEGNWDHMKIDDLISYLETIRTIVTKNLP